MKKLADHIYMTNADRFRSMTDEELAEKMSRGIISFHCTMCEEELKTQCDAKCIEHCLNWLRQPAKEV